MTKRLVIPLICSLLLLFTLSNAQPITSFEFGEVQNLTLKYNETAYYKFTLKELKSDYDISIVAHPKSDNDPELFLSTTEKYPNSKENSEYYSTTYGYSSIYIPEEELEAGTTYYLGATCVSEICDFTLMADYAQEYFMRPFVEKAIIDYVHGGSLIARVYIPDLPDIGHIVFAAETENLNEVDQSLTLYANAGNDIPTSGKYDFTGSVAWKDGKAAYVYKGDKKFCTNCNYTVVVEAPKKSKIVLRRMIYGPQIPMVVNSEGTDAVEAGFNVTYAVNITQFSGSLDFVSVEILPFYGIAHVYINQDNLPKDLSGYKYSITGHGQEQILVPIQRQPGNSTLYVTVLGKTHSTYTLRVAAIGKENKYLKLGEPQVGYIVGKDVANFLVVSDGTKNMKMTFSVHPEMGKTDLFVKTCQDKNNCSFTNDELKKILDGTIQTSKKMPILQFSNITDGDEIVTVEMDGTVCEAASGSGSPNCYFAIGVQGTVDGSNKFTVNANRVGLHQDLRANVPSREHLDIDQYKYYVFLVGNDTGIDSVNFQVTKISGDVSVYISRTTRYPDLQDREKPHHYNDFYSFEKQQFTDLRGNYYIAVKARSSATYSIVPIVKYSTDIEFAQGQHIIKLNEGIPQKTVLDNEEAAYFKFDVWFEESQTTTGLEVALNEVQGIFEIVVTNDGEIPVPGSSQPWSTDSNNLILTPSDKGYSKSATYFVGVFPKYIKSDTGSSSPRAQSFSITWSALHNFRTMSYGVPFYNYVANNKTLFYKFEVHPTEDKEIVIHTTVATSNSNVDMYIANLETKLGHDVDAFNADKTTKGTGSNTLKLVQADINNLCGTYGAIKCYLYLAIATASTNNVYVTITLTKDFDDLRLSESVETFYSFPTKEHPIHLYYYPHQLEDITILAHTWGRNLTLYGKVINTKEHSSRQDWLFPTNKKFEYVSKESASHRGESRLYIPAEDLSQCGADYVKFRCGIALTLYYDKAQETSDSYWAHSFFESNMFSILANQEITPIAAGKPVQTTVNEGEYRYFSLFVNKDEATLLISASVLSGQHIIILATKGKDARPTKETAEFRSYYGKMETLEVSGDQTKQGNAKGYWVIAIYGESSSEFVLNVVFEKNKMLELHRGLPINADANNDTVYFEYYHEATASFQFKLTKQRGTGTISLKSYRDNQQIAGNLPTKTDGDIVQRFDNVQSVIEVLNRTKVFCSSCLYVMGIFPDTEMKVSVVVQIPGQFIYLQDNMIFTDYASSVVQNKYEHISWTGGQVDINVIVYSGEPHIYIAHNSAVNETNYLWSYTTSSFKNYIRMRLDNTEYMKGMEPVWDGAKNVSQYPGMYYILVTAPIPSNYSIAVSVSNSTRYLFDGHQDFGFLNAGEFNVYKYHVTKDNVIDDDTNRLKLQVILHRDEFFLLFNNETDDIQEPNITVMAVPTNKSIEVPINPYTNLPDLPALTTIRKDALKRGGYGDQHYTMNLQFEASVDQDFYIIVNNTQSEQHLNYSIVANSHEPLMLTMNNVYASRASVQDTDVYAVHVGHTGILVIEIHNCIGKVMVQTSRNKHFKLSPLREDDSNLSGDQDSVDDESFNSGNQQDNDEYAQVASQITSSMGNHITLASLNIEKEGTIYIAVTAIDGVQIDDDFLNEAVYKIRPNLYPLRSFQPFVNLQPGGEGLIDWEIPEKGKLKVDFQEVKNLAFSGKVKSSKYGELSIIYAYELILSKDVSAGLYYARCDMTPKQQGKFTHMDTYVKVRHISEADVHTVENDTSHKYLQARIPEEFDKLYATLKVYTIGVDQQGNSVWDYPVIYHSAEITPYNPPSRTLLVILLCVAIGLLLLTLIGLSYYYDKFKRVKKMLNYEMQDLRNIATTVESFDTVDDNATKKGGYAGLIEDAQAVL